jgi:hypothetical protein
MGVYQYLDLSTKHLPEYEMQQLSERADRVDGDVNDGIIADNFPYGTWVHVSYERPSDLAGFVELPKVLAYARKTGAAWVRFDRDGDVHDDLPTWEW